MTRIKFDLDDMEYVLAPLPEQMQQEVNEAILPALKKVAVKWGVPIELISKPEWTRAFDADSEKKS